VIICVIMLHLAGAPFHVFETRVNTTKECHDIAREFLAAGFGIAVFTDSRAVSLDKRQR